jgi:hypothetical protein
MTTSEPSDQPSEFSRAWRRSFGCSPPLGHVLRYEHFEFWTRFHSLPESKRYAECDEETGTIVDRANTLATECFGEQASIWISAGYLSDFDLENDDLPIRMNMSKEMVWIDEDEEPEDQSEMSFFASRLIWKRSSLDRLFREIAEDQERAILFSEDAQTVLAPYDGGFDIISFQPGKIAQLENSFSTWMSSRSDKL